MKKAASIMASILLAAALLSPAQASAAKSSSDIQQELRAVEKQAQEAKQQQQAAEAKRAKSAALKKAAQHDLGIVLTAINEVNSQIARVSNDITKTEMGLRQAKKDLVEAQERIKAREGMIDTRVRMMYTDGMVSYLDVLMSSNSFSDFVERADSLRMIVDQDQDILAQHEKDKQFVVVTQNKLKANYALAKGLYAEKAKRKGELDAKENEKQRLIAKYDLQIQNAEDTTAEQEQALWDLADKRASLYREKTAVEAQERAAAAARAAAEAAARSAASDSGSGSSGGGGGYSGSGNGLLSVPVAGARLSSPFGYRTNPVTGIYKLHAGVDFAAPQGTDITAADGGTVVVAGAMSGYGNAVIIDHGNGIQTLYGHIRNGGVMVHAGQSVSRGEKIAEVGSTGNSTGPHCHFEVRVNGSPVDPMGYL
ncbi:murein hydrolase activator EnvC family protein [Paenibacillus sp. SGZ-1009]|uniref:murein hydrolase activator EnvC family protein n=1 Tax=Paenibacillus campi TaxID=3106031 RepID=UPI002AFDC9E6|nr:peptidoglycan DD-metalloendopeptidase family protein [Paenibacillus sp. SGZ-1009]